MGEKFQFMLLVFLINSLMFARPMVCMRAAFHENDGNGENDETTQTSTNKELSAGLAGIMPTTAMTKTTGIWGANHGFPKEWV